MLRKLAVWGLAVVVTIFPVCQVVGDDVLKTEHGARLKLIVRHDTAVFAEPNVSSRSQPLRQFEFFFVLPADKSGLKTKDGFYRIAAGTSEANAIGWIKTEDIVEWPHTQVLGFTKRAERERANFFASQQAIESYLHEGSTDQAISREPDGVEILSLLPILMETEIEVNGEKVKTFQVAYIHTADPKNVFAPKESLTIPQIQKELTLDVVFVIDTTSSMTPYIEAAKEVIRKIAAAVNSNQNVKGRVRLGLVGYRDKGDEYVSKVLCSLETGTNLTTFETALGKTKAEGGGDNPEQVFAGLRTAVTEMNWNDIANRHIILIGDAPNHEDDNSLVSAESVLAAAQPGASSDDVEALLQHITIHTLQVGEGAGTEFETCRRQFSTLAAGRDFAGASASTANVSSFMNSLVTTLTNRVDGTEYAIKGEIKKLEAMADPNAGSIGVMHPK
jgi:serine/threonine-protein kinase PpkA